MVIKDTEISKLPIVQALIEVMKEVGAVGKDDRNSAQNFAFRGIDAVVNAVSPALQRYGVIVVPSVDTYEYSTITIGKNRTEMGHVKVRVTYTFIGSLGDKIETSVAAEAMDSGDKATAKAMSVAFRTALLQSLCLPTNDADPDASSYERAEKIKPQKADFKPAHIQPPEGSSVDWELLLAAVDNLKDTEEAKKMWVARKEILDWEIPNISSTLREVLIQKVAILPAVSIGNETD